MNERAQNRRREAGNNKRQNQAGRHALRLRENRRRRRARKRLGLWLRAVAAAGVAAYFLTSLRYGSAFLPNTVVGGIDVSGKTVDEVKAGIAEGIGGYELVLEERDGGQERLIGSDFDLRPVFDQSLEQILEGQNALLWGMRWFKGEEYGRDCMVAFDNEKLRERIGQLNCLDPELTEEPADARLAYVSGQGLQMIPETYGNAPDRELLTAGIEAAVYGLRERVSLEELGVYRTPTVLDTDPELQNRLETLKPYADVAVTYRFGSRTEVLDGGRTLQWLSVDGGGNVTVDQAGVEAYVQELAEAYNTAYRAKQLETSYGPTVTITAGHYGWMIDKQRETEELTKIILSGESQEREPVYLQRAASHDGPDYGDTYVELNLTAQHLYFYKDGKLLIQSDFVSGDQAKGWSTPAGAYELTYKQKNAVLRGKTYKTPVTYWMPFNGNIGMHDGYWRSSFGGTIYKKNGSHGCVNLPPAVAKTIFENIEAGIPVLCYHLDGTETARTTSASLGKAPGGGGGAGADAGTAGAAGESGTAGTAGAAGGAKGAEAVGAAGGTETAGAAGETGAAEAAGETGAAGTAGEAGTAGAAGGAETAGMPGEAEAAETTGASETASVPESAVSGGATPLIEPNPAPAAGP